jgi:hypothetical protein
LLFHIVWLAASEHNQHFNNNILHLQKPARISQQNLTQCSSRSVVVVVVSYFLVGRKPSLHNKSTHSSVVSC